MILPEVIIIWVLFHVVGGKAAHNNSGENRNGNASNDKGRVKKHNHDPIV